MGVIPGQTGTDMLFYWPITELGIMGAKASVELFFGDLIRNADNQDETREQLLKEYEEDVLRIYSHHWIRSTFYK